MDEVRTKEITYGRKIVFDNGDRYRTTHLEYAKTIEVAAGADIDKVSLRLEEEVDAYLAAKAVESRFGVNYGKDATTVRKIEAYEREVNSFLKSINLGHCKVEL